MKCLKERQLIIYVIALMLITAGYLNYMNKTKEKESDMQTASSQVVEQASPTAIPEATPTENNKETEIQNNEQQNSENQNEVIENKEEVAEIGDAELVSSNDVTTGDYFENSKIERDKMYSQMIEVYQNVINSTSAEEAQKKVATEEIQKINNIKNSIMICENLIKTKGFENNVILVNSDNVNVIVGTVELEKEEVAQIQNIIEREMKTNAKNIHISIK